MARSVRLLYRGVRGTVRRNVNFDPISVDSAVVITAAEFIRGFPLPGKRTGGRPHLGDARVYVTNVGPHNPEGEAGGVEFLLHVEWNAPLDVAVTITVLDDIEAFFQV